MGLMLREGSFIGDLNGGKEGFGKWVEQALGARGDGWCISLVLEGLVYIKGIHGRNSRLRGQGSKPVID